jgi:hypothetical protein
MLCISAADGSFTSLGSYLNPKAKSGLEHPLAGPRIRRVAMDNGCAWEAIGHRWRENCSLYADAAWIALRDVVLERKAGVSRFKGVPLLRY